jgi:hypothetical protein
MEQVGGRNDDPSEGGLAGKGMDVEYLDQQRQSDKSEPKRSEVGQVEAEKIRQQVTVHSEGQPTVTDEGVCDGGQMGDQQDHEVVHLPLKQKEDTREEQIAEQSVVGAHHQEPKLFPTFPLPTKPSVARSA